MSLKIKSISPSILAAMLLSACGGGDGNGDNHKVVSSHLDVPVMTAQSPDTVKASAGNKGADSTTGTDTPRESSAQASAPQNKARKPAFLEPQKLRGDAIATMLDATTPVTVTSSSQTRDVYDDHGNIIDTIYEEKWKHLPDEFMPLDDSGNATRDLVGHPRIAAGSHTVPDFYSPAREIEGHNLSGMKKYEPAQGEYILNVYSKPVESDSAKEAYSFQAMSLTLIANASRNSLSLPNRLVLTLGADPFTSYPGWRDRQSILLANAKRVIRHNQQFPENETIQTWESAKAKVRLFWRKGQDNQDAQMCYEISYNLDSENPGRRLHCSLWRIQKDWSYGHRFENGGVYIEDTPNAPGTGSRTFRWSVNGQSYMVDIG